MALRGNSCELARPTMAKTSKKRAIHFFVISFPCGQIKVVHEMYQIYARRTALYRHTFDKFFIAAKPGRAVLIGFALTIGKSAVSHWPR